MTMEPGEPQEKRMSRRLHSLMMVGKEEHANVHSLHHNHKQHRDPTSSLHEQQHSHSEGLNIAVNFHLPLPQDGKKKAQKSRLQLLSIAVDVESAPVNLQMELIELQCNDTLKAKFESVSAAEFARFIPDTMPELRTQVARTLSMFGSTYLCEQLFSLMKLNKTSHRSRLTDEHLNSVLRISSAQTPNIDELVLIKMRHQVSS
ncbi:general transcription factor II-I repeat domain-containing protein 2-like [Solea senegalensis]|uniref:General transcription factor II-I repeat domain-containing protein 2-like n=1 Tax=Solea senegalensis TaxID=28829 RepID=A0AAV6Q5V9_SOLSE|nr:general transcription factor II-I repeat domain-containing protein 2-like [Solea senegalensis]